MQTMYTLKTSNHYRFFTGVLMSGNQFIVGRYDTNQFLAVVFNSSGNFLYIHRENYAFDPKGSADEDKLILNIWREINGYELRSIQVFKFYLDDLRVGIESYPGEMELGKDNNKITKDEKNDMIADSTDWIARGDYVFWWNRDFWMNNAGEVIAS